MYSTQLPTAGLLHNKPASSGLSPGNFFVQVHDKTYALCDVNLLHYLMVLCPNCHG